MGNWVHQSVDPHKVIRCDLVVTKKPLMLSLHHTELTSKVRPAPSATVRYGSLPLPAAFLLFLLPVLALECFCCILNRLIEQCSRETACQSQLKTQKQKIKKACGWTPVLIKKKKKGKKESRESPTDTKYLFWNANILHIDHNSDGWSDNKNLSKIKNYPIL